MMFQSPRKRILIPLFIILIALGIIFLGRNKRDDSVVDIVLTPQYEDAVLSLGGLLAKGEHPTLVATFFEPHKAEAKDSFGALVTYYDYESHNTQNGTSTDETISLNLSQDIQALIASYGDKTVRVYAPSNFLPVITDNDQSLLHEAFLNVAESYPNSNVSFYFYEDFPYVDQFNKASVISVEKNLENTTGRIFEDTRIELTVGDVRKKEKALERLNTSLTESSIDFTKKRCGETACEVVYKLFKI